MEVQRLKQPSPRRERFRSGTRCLRRKSDVAHTKSILSAASSQAVTWTIGSKPRANRDRNEPTPGNVRRQRSNQVGARRPLRLLYGVDGSPLGCGKKTALLDGSERHRGG